MFLKAFKEKSSRKYLNKLLSDRKLNVDNKKIKSVGVILNYDETQDFKILKPLMSQLGVQPNAVKLIAYTKDPKGLGNSLNACYNPNDFAWGGVVKNEEIKAFTNTKFDLLVSYYTEDLVNLKLLTALTPSQIKIGILQSDMRINDIIVNTALDATRVFNDEVIKYLTVLNKI
jgi:hypothetical protein